MRRIELTVPAPRLRLSVRDGSFEYQFQKKTKTPEKPIPGSKRANATSSFLSLVAFPNYKPVSSFADSHRLQSICSVNKLKLRLVESGLPIALFGSAPMLLLLG